MVKGCVKMFEVGERVVYGHHGVCEIVKIDTLDMPNVPKRPAVLLFVADDRWHQHHVCAG